MARSSFRVWCVLYRPAHRGAADPWLLITEVPTTVSREEMLEALRAAPLWARWSARMDLDGRLVVRRWVRDDGELSFLERLSWDELAPGTRKLSLPVPGALHARLRRAAAAEGQSLTQWATAHLEAAVPADVP